MEPWDGVYVKMVECTREPTASQQTRVVTLGDEWEVSIIFWQRSQAEIIGFLHDRRMDVEAE